MIKLHYLSDSNFIELSLKKMTKQNTKIQRIILIISILLILLSIYFDIMLLLMLSTFIFGVLFFSLYLMSKSIMSSRKSLALGLVSETFEISDHKVILESVYNNRTLNMKIDITAINKIHWHNDGFIVVVDVFY